MNAQPDFDPTSLPVPPKKSLWQKLGGTSLTVSILFHLVLLAAGLMWVFKIITPPEKIVVFTPRSGGGGAPASETMMNQQRVRMMEPHFSRRIVCGGIESIIAIPESEEMTPMESLVSLSSSTLSGGQGGPGTGGGKGDGDGPGIGSSLAPGMTTGGGSKTPFGTVNPDKGALVGTFYDLKQTRSGKASELNEASVQSEIVGFTNRGWRESAFNAFFKAQQTLQQSKIYIPIMDADGAPAAFNCADQVRPSRWVVVYRGMVTPPRTGKYRFVGAGDDILVVRINGRNVFDHGYYSGTVPLYIAAKHGALMNKGADPAMEKEIRRNYPMELPLKTYQYDTTKNYNSALGGLGVGPQFEARQDQEYPIEILINELPGGKFGAVLLIEEEGVEYKKASTGAPILPIFRLDGSVPEGTKADNAPPYDPNGPVWKVRGDRGKPEI